MREFPGCKGRSWRRSAGLTTGQITVVLRQLYCSRPAKDCHHQRGKIAVGFLDLLDHVAAKTEHHPRLKTDDIGIARLAGKIGDLADNRVRVNLAAFYTIYRDIQLAQIYFEGSGATLVQGYTAFLYRGPGWARAINRGLARRAVSTRA